MPFAIAITGCCAAERVHVLAAAYAAMGAVDGRVVALLGAGAECAAHARAVGVPAAIPTQLITVPARLIEPVSSS